MPVHHKYTVDEENFLISNSSLLSRKELTDIFNKTYGTNISVKSITNKCNTMKSFGKTSRYSIGDEVVRSDGYVLVKITDNPKVPQYKRWVLKHRFVWEKEFGEIPKGKILIFKDGNTQNCDISNLILVDRKSSMVMARNNLFNENAEITYAGVCVSKLVLKLAELERRKKN